MAEKIFTTIIISDQLLEEQPVTKEIEREAFTDQIEDLNLELAEGPGYFLPR